MSGVHIGLEHFDASGSAQLQEIIVQVRSCKSLSLPHDPGSKNLKYCPLPSLSNIGHQTHIKWSKPSNLI